MMPIPWSARSHELLPRRMVPLHIHLRRVGAAVTRGPCGCSPACTNRARIIHPSRTSSTIPPTLLIYAPHIDAGRRYVGVSQHGKSEGKKRIGVELSKPVRAATAVNWSWWRAHASQRTHGHPTYARTHHVCIRSRTHNVHVCVRCRSLVFVCVCAFVRTQVRVCFSPRVLLRAFRLALTCHAPPYMITHFHLLTQMSAR